MVLVKTCNNSGEGGLGKENLSDRRPTDTTDMVLGLTSGGNLYTYGGDAGVQVEAGLGSPI